MLLLSISQTKIVLLLLWNVEAYSSICKSILNARATKNLNLNRDSSSSNTFDISLKKRGFIFKFNIIPHQKKFIPMSITWNLKNCERGILIRFLNHFWWFIARIHILNNFYLKNMKWLDINSSSKLEQFLNNSIKRFYFSAIHLWRISYF